MARTMRWCDKVARSVDAQAQINVMVVTKSVGSFFW
jgi:hypothetical protein